MYKTLSSPPPGVIPTDRPDSASPPDTQHTFMSESELGSYPEETYGSRDANTMDVSTFSQLTLEPVSEMRTVPSSPPNLSRLSMEDTQIQNGSASTTDAPPESPPPFKNAYCIPNFEVSEQAESMLKPLAQAMQTKEEADQRYAMIERERVTDMVEAIEVMNDMDKERERTKFLQAKQAELMQRLSELESKSDKTAGS